MSPTDRDDQSPRYALYFVPRPDSRLARFGSAWLGYDAGTGRDIPRAPLSGLPPDALETITREPRRYGFHATLKPPFRLNQGTSEAALVRATQDFVATRRASGRGALCLQRIAGFLALVPEAMEPEVAQLAADCVRHFDALRRPPGEAELARRLAGGLSPVQTELLQRWGYPYVLEEFRFHMTLTGTLDPPLGPCVEAVLAERLAEAGPLRLRIEDVALCRQQPGKRFTVLGRFPLARS